MSETELQKFGSRVRTLREEKTLSQEQFADLAGLHRNYVVGLNAVKEI